MALSSVWSCFADASLPNQDSLVGGAILYRKGRGVRTVLFARLIPKSSTKDAIQLTTPSRNCVLHSLARVAAHNIIARQTIAGARSHEETTSRVLALVPRSSGRALVHSLSPRTYA